ncbi:hypothetical protein FACS1894142_5970 [Spirochaetia bacterium]|nr:hypothetical protein FACS1894142_5970 [Spirochaetia bacterium]
MNRISRMMIQCGYRFNCPLEIEQMSYTQLKFWYEADAAYREAEKPRGTK